MPKHVDTIARRQDFLSASRRVIAGDGLDAATMRRVAAEAGCTTGALTHYFTDRDALLVETLRAAHEAAAHRMMRALADHPAPGAKLRAVCAEALPLDDTRLREWRVWLAFWAAAAGNARLEAENHRRTAEWRDVLTSLVAPLAGPATPRAVSVLLAVIDGLGLAATTASAPGIASMSILATLEETLALLGLAP